MKRMILGILLLMGFCMNSFAENVSGVSVRNFSVVREGDYMSVEMFLDLSALHVGDNRAVLLTPRIIHDADSVDLSSIGVYGRRRYYYYVRNGEGMLSGGDERSYRKAEKPDTMSYHVLVPYSDWMNGAALCLYRGEYGCCSNLLKEESGLLGLYSVFEPEWLFVRPKGKITTGTIHGRAYVEFRTDSTRIDRKYRKNEQELDKIFASIDSVRNDKDITITEIQLKGFASPESPYSHNTDLAIGRTLALKEYIHQLRHFDKDVVKTSYEPEDWEGLQRFVENSNLEHRIEILDIIGEPLDPDVKEAKIKRLYPGDYRFMLENFYPALRHTDYTINYYVRHFTDVNEIRDVMKSKPQKLSLEEFYLLAEEYESGSEEFNEVFETAVRMYPDDTEANLNAANAAMQRNDLKAAERYLAKAGGSAQASYARGIHAVLKEDYVKAESLMLEAKAGGVTAADGALRYIWNKIGKK